MSKNNKGNKANEIMEGVDMNTADTKETKVAEKVVEAEHLFKNTSGKTIMFSGTKILANEHIKGTDKDFVELVNRKLITKIEAGNTVFAKPEVNKEDAETMVY